MGSRGVSKEDARIGKLVRVIRHKANISQTELGQAIGVTFQQIQKYEKGTNRIGSGRLVALAAALGVEAGQFFQTSGRKHNGISDEILELFADKRNLRALTAFANIKSGKVKAAFLDVLERTSEQH